MNGVPNIPILLAMIPCAAMAIHVMAACSVCKLRSQSDTAWSLRPDLKSAPLALLGALCLGAIYLAVPDFYGTDFVGALLVLLLASGALADARWAWAPDTLMLPIALLAPMFGGHAFWPALAITLGLVIVPLAIWCALLHFRKPIMTPPDIMAVMLPPTLFGLHPMTSVLYVLIAIVLLIALRIPQFRGSAAALADAGLDTGLEEVYPARPRAAALAIIFPLLMLALTLKLSGIL